MIAHDDRDLDTLARTLWGEARGETEQGRIAVAWVIRNRAGRAAFAGHLLGRDGAVDRVCKAAWQFSCWNASDPNRAKLVELHPKDFPTERLIAERVLSGRALDPTAGADHYHTIAAPAWAAAWPPDWAPAMAETARFGGHVFYDSRNRFQP